jgi:hypothetical protein
MAEPRTAPCEPWTTEDDVLAVGSLCRLTGDARPSAAVVERAIDVASELLYERTGRRWPGQCTTTVRIDSSYDCVLLPVPWHSGWRLGDVPRDPIGNREGLRVGYTPIVEVTAVTAADEVLTLPADVEVWDHRYLLRTDGEAWRFPVEATFVHGRRPTAAGRLAATVLAAELALAATGTACRLPERVQSAQRQGVGYAWVDAMEYLSSGLLGITEVDYFLSTYPNHRRARVVRADDPLRVHRRT